MQDFDTAQFMGDWYEAQHSRSTWFHPHMESCQKTSFSQYNEDTDEFEVVESSVVFGKRVGVTGTGHFTDHGYGTINLLHKAREHPNFHVCDTDYESYALVYWCSLHELEPQLWILSRAQTVDDQWLEQINETAKLFFPNYDYEKLAEKAI